MEFSIEFYVSACGDCPVLDFLEDLRRSNPNDYAAVMAGLAKLRHRNYHRPPLSKPVVEGLFELRHVGKLNTRVLYFFMKGQRIIVVHGIRNKSQEIPLRDYRVALQRMQEWMSRQRP